MLTRTEQGKIQELKREFEELKPGKESLLAIIDEAELPEAVFNSNAIENSTLTLKETEQILLKHEVARNVSVRELYEAQNLADVTEYIRKRTSVPLNEELTLRLHQMLLGNIDSSIAGRFRRKGEFVRVGSYIAPAPEHVESMFGAVLLDYTSETQRYFLERISLFHLEFENIHPFNDGNGRIGRVLINLQLLQNGLPPLIIRNKNKERHYYPAFDEYRRTKKTRPLDRLLWLALMESLHKRIAYLRGQRIVTVSERAKATKRSVQALLNAARRQSIPAFREKGVWKIGVAR